MMTAEDRKRRASMGGKALRPEQRSFSQNRQLASEAGRKGGSSPKKKLATLAVESERQENQQRNAVESV
jgi:general stress protein YciG